MTEFDYTQGVQPTTYGLGPFHPAIRNGRSVKYWPNITFASETEAYNWASRALADALQPTVNDVAGWNVYEVGEP